MTALKASLNILQSSQYDTSGAMDSKVQHSSWSIATYLRIRPLNVKTPSVKYFIEDVKVGGGAENRGIVEIDIPPDADPGLVHNNSLSGKLKYEFDRVFDENVNQEKIFLEVVSDKILEVFDGVNCTIFAYGQTGSGKTFSMCGGDSYKDRGVIPRSLELVFTEVKHKLKTVKPFSFKCQLSFCEIYKEIVFDLLHPDRKVADPIEAWPVVQVMEATTGMVMRNLSVYNVATVDDAMQLYFMGNSNRMTASTSMNDVSSRSHAVFTVVITSESVKGGNTIFSSGKINLVDLAGSERVFKMSNTKGNIDEAKYINLSLHYLEQVIVCLRERALQNKGVSNVVADGFIPYRNSALTSMLRDSLGGNCRSGFLLTITPEKLHFEESIATCRFGQRCGEVKLKISANTEIGLPDQLKELTSRVKHLEKQLQHSGDLNRRLSAALESERLSRIQETDTRLLSEEEKDNCKRCVQTLLSTTKEAITSGSLASSPEGGVMIHSPEINDDLLTSSQDQLYDTVGLMDRAVLVELSTSLGVLVQQMFVEREMQKSQEMSKQAQIRKNEAAKNNQNNALWEREEVFRAGPLSSILSLKALPESIVTKITAGAVFVKYGFLGTRKAKFIYVSKDLQNLCVRPVLISNAQTLAESTKIFSFKSFECAANNKLQASSGCFQSQLRNKHVRYSRTMNAQSNFNIDCDDSLGQQQPRRSEEQEVSEVEPEEEKGDEDNNRESTVDEAAEQFHYMMELPQHSNSVFIRGVPSVKSMSLEVVDGLTDEDNCKMAYDWINAINYLIYSCYI